MAGKKPRIETSGTQAGLGQPFAALALSGLPSGPAEVPEAPAPLSAPQRGRVVLRREKAHRGGKTVVVVDDFATSVAPDAIEEVARVLRVKCGCGGTVRDRRIEVQGDQPGEVRAVLVSLGFQVAGVT